MTAADDSGKTHPRKPLSDYGKPWFQSGNFEGWPKGARSKIRGAEDS